MAEIQKPLFRDLTKLFISYNTFTLSRYRNYVLCTSYYLQAQLYMAGIHSASFGITSVFPNQKEGVILCNPVLLNFK